MRRVVELSTLLAVTLLAGCPGSPLEHVPARGPLPRAENEDGNHRVSLLYFQGPPCGGTSSIVATGPGPAPDFATTSVPLTCSSGAWSATIALGSAHPDPQTAYTFTVRDGATAHDEIGYVPCYVDTLPVPLEPTGATTVASPVTFTWNVTGGFLGAPSEYSVYVFGTDDPPRKSVVGQSSLSFALPPRWYPSWAVELSPVGGWEPDAPLRCSGRNTGGAAFVVGP